MKERMCEKKTISYKGRGTTNQSIIEGGHFGTTMVIGFLIMWMRKTVREEMPRYIKKDCMLGNCMPIVPQTIGRIVHIPMAYPMAIIGSITSLMIPNSLMVLGNLTM